MSRKDSLQWKRFTEVNGGQVHLSAPIQRPPRHESATTHAAAVSTQVA
jgi:hypothetical protein